MVVLTVSVDEIVPLAAGVTEAGAKPQFTVALAGEMEQVKATAELKLLTEVTVIVELVLFPAVVVATAGVEFIVKSGAAPTFNR